MADVFEHAAEHRPHWIHVWKHILRDMLNWSESRIDSWLQCFDSELNGTDVSGSMWFYHDPVLRRIAPLFVRDELAKQLRSTNRLADWPNDLMGLHDDIERAATFTSDHVYCNDVDYCWNSARQRVVDVLAKHDAEVPPNTYTTSFESTVRNPN